MLEYPLINPVAVSIGPIAIRWYSIAYIAGIVIGWLILKRLNKKLPVLNLSEKAIEDLVMYATLGIVFGGRLGYCLIYNHSYYLQNPLEIVYVWKGGMAFHGGFLGLVTGVYLFCKKYKIEFLELMDRIALVSPIGLFFGRIANFINGELYGRLSDSPLAMVFPNGGDLPRHPSQLYQAGMEGLALGLVLLVVWRAKNKMSSNGLICGVFLIGYAIARIIGEIFREPDEQLGFLFAHITMGQILCAPMLIFGIFLILRSKKTA